MEEQRNEDLKIQQKTYNADWKVRTRRIWETMRVILSRTGRLNTVIGKQTKTKQNLY